MCSIFNKDFKKRLNFITVEETSFFETKNEISNHFLYPPIE